jgi:hypothetical protein
MPITEPSAPERKTTPGTSRASRPASQPAPSRTAARAEAIDGIFQIAGTACVVTKNYADAGAIALHKDAIALETAKVADANEKVAALIDKLTSVGPYAGLLTAVLPLALQLAANHGRIDATKTGGLMGIQTPEVLAAQIRAEMDNKKAEFLREQELAARRASDAQMAVAKMESRINAA